MGRRGGGSTLTRAWARACNGARRREASTYTEYEQLGNVARVTGTVSISACPAGTTGKFALVARIKDEAGTSTPIEFTEMWESPDAQDYTFFADYPIGDNVFLENVRVRNLVCTCEEPAQ